MGDTTQSGSFSGLVSAGDTFAITAWSLTGELGAATTIISNFVFESEAGPNPGPIPEPGTLALLAVALAATALTRRRAD